MIVDDILIVDATGEKTVGANPDISDVAALIADPSRASMLMVLLGGQTLLASELARIAGITPQTASSHLAKMVDRHLLTVESRGRHRYFRLASPEVAHALESLTTIAAPLKVRSLRQSDQAKALRFARSCYDHLAGEVGVAVTTKLMKRQWLILEEGNFTITDVGISGFADLGVNMLDLSSRRRAVARPCLDWSERRHHVAGSLGAALATRFFDLEWIRRTPSTRAVTITAKGSAGLRQYFGIQVEDLRADTP